MNSTEALRELVEKHFPTYGDRDFYKTVQMARGEEFLSDLTALISEGYVSKKAYNVIKEHYQSALAAKDIDRDYINKYYYPKEFVKWTMKKIRERSVKLHDINGCYRVWVPSPYASAWVLMTTDELFNYWKENER